MRKTLTSVTAAFAMLALTASAVAADVTVIEGSLDNRRCIDDPNEGRCITGTFEVEAGSEGSVDIVLYGSTTGDGTDDEELARQTIQVTDNQTVYEYTFCSVPLENADGDAYVSYRVRVEGATNPEQADSIDVENDCREGIIPEVPAAILLLVTGGLFTTWYVVRRMRPARSQMAAA